MVAQSVDWSAEATHGALEQYMRRWIATADSANEDEKIAESVYLLSKSVACNRLRQYAMQCLRHLHVEKRPDKLALYLQQLVQGWIVNI